MRVRCRAQRWLLILNVALLPGIVLAEMNADALKQQIQERSANIKEFRALLNDPDQTVRLAALDTMLKSSDIAMRELAYSVGFSSADDAMRAVCLTNKIADMQTIVIKIGEMDNPTDTEKKTLSKWGGVYDFDIKAFDEKTGQFTTSGNYKNGKGQVNGIGIEFSHPYCSGSFTLGDGASLNGELGCKGAWSGTYPGQIRLQ